jgi:trk system potassium uptake protein TrkH
MTGISLFVGMAFTLFAEWNNPELVTLKDKLLAAFFQSSSIRTAGFNTVELDGLTDATKAVYSSLMFVGGSAGSTAGGVKTATVALLIVSAFRISCGRKDVVIFKRRIQNETIRHAAAILIVYMAAVLVSTTAICFVDGISLQDGLFETIAAVSTVGYTRVGIYNMSMFSRVIIMILMYGGRIGFMSLLMVFWEKDKGDAPVEHPTEEIMIG